MPDATDAFRSPVDGVFHLAATMTAHAERDFGRGIEVNVGAFIEFLDDCRAHNVPRLVFSSSMAAFGGPLPDIVPDEIAQRPQSSYGVQKVIAELLLDDYTRRGFLDARALRLPVVLLRPPGGAPTISGAISAVICEPLEGRNVVCGFPPDARMPVASVGAVARALIRVFELPSEALGAVRTINLPALTVTMNQMIAALERCVGPAARELVKWQLDLQMTEIMAGMPKGMSSTRANSAGIIPEPDFDSVIADYARGVAAFRNKDHAMQLGVRG
jgi:D-erythronate 2-dehydrogenase